jgi:hypothetical protein
MRSKRIPIKSESEDSSGESFTRRLFKRSETTTAKVQKLDAADLDITVDLFADGKIQRWVEQSEHPSSLKDRLVLKSIAQNIKKRPSLQVEA